MLQYPWAQKDSMNVAIRSHASIVLDGKLYISGWRQLKCQYIPSTIEGMIPKLIPGHVQTAKWIPARTNFATYRG